jgi:hypothetical protein
MDSSLLDRNRSTKPAASLAWTFTISPTRIWRQPDLLQPPRNLRMPASRRRATGAKKKMCRQGITQGVVPLLLSCPPGSAILSPAPPCTCLHRIAGQPDTPSAKFSGPLSNSRLEADISRGFFSSHAMRGTDENSPLHERKIGVPNAKESPALRSPVPDADALIKCQS